MNRNGQSLPVDRAARSLFGRAEIAARNGDAKLALQVCADVTLVAAEYRLVLRTGEDAQPQPDPRRAGGQQGQRPSRSGDEKRAGDQPARGSPQQPAARTFRARYDDRCAVCGKAIRAGEPIFYGGPKLASHQRCGEAEG